MIELLTTEKFVATALVCISILLLIIIVLIALIWVRTRRTQLKINAIFQGKKATNLEGVILHNNKKLKDFDTEIQELFDISNKINVRANKSLNKIGVERFNPFRDYTGNQSFALALLNSQDDGVIISSIHTREGTRIYTKQVEKGSPVNNEFTEEEKNAITQAK